MKLPKGFGKNYFSLSAITATVNQVTLHATSTRTENFHFLQFENEENEAELEEELATSCTQQLSSTACHCNCYFFKRTRKTLALFFTQNLFFRYFTRLNNSISPPISLFYLI